jgi:hypothetical protein
VKPYPLRTGCSDAGSHGGLDEEWFLRQEIPQPGCAGMAEDGLRLPQCDRDATLEVSRFFGGVHRRQDSMETP